MQRRGGKLVTCLMFILGFALQTVFGLNLQRILSEKGCVIELPVPSYSEFMPTLQAAF